jgi:rhodanese-related sulfurtransferase
MLAVVVLLSLAGTASAETVKGTVKAIAAEIRFFSLTVSPEKVLVISWDNKTAWKGMKSAADLKLDERLHVDVLEKGDITVAASVARVKTPLPAGIMVITLDQLAAGLDNKELTLVDTRAVELYDAGHIPGAVPLPLARLEKRTYGLLPESKAAKVVFYDEGQGGDSAGRATEIAAKAGYSDSAIFPEGASGWIDAGKFLAASTNFIRKASPTVIDLRPQAAFAQGRITKAVNYPFTDLRNYFGNLPIDMLTPIVLYGDSDKDALAAAAMLRERGHRRVTIYLGGTDAWLKSAEVLETGPASEELSTAAARHGGGTLQPNDFEMALLSPVMVEIVDVRSAADRKKGGFPQAKHIPVQDLAKKHGELNRAKIQVLFAADPVQAEMAYDFLGSKGYRVNYLYGTVEFGKEGQYKVK